MSSINTNPALYSLMTPEELSLAKAHRINQDANKWFRLYMTSECNDEKMEAEEALKEIRINKAEQKHLFTKEYWSELSGIDVLFMGEEEAKAGLAELHKRLSINFGFEPFNLPKQGYSVNSTLNAITIGIGSKVPMDGYHLWVFEFMVGAVKNGTQPPPDTAWYSDTTSPYVLVLNRLLGAVSSENSSWANDPEMNRATLSFLRKLGVDTGRDFKINDIVFEVIDGIIQTKGYVAPQPRRFLGEDGLNKLVEKAYAKNIFYD